MQVAIEAPENFQNKKLAKRVRHFAQRRPEVNIQLTCEDDSFVRIGAGEEQLLLNGQGRKDTASQGV